MPPELQVVVIDCRHIEAVRAVAALSFQRSWSPQDFGYFLAHECRLVGGIFDGERLVAYFLGLVVQGELDIISVATHPDFRRRGLAEKLLRWACAQGNVQRAFLEVSTANESAIALYRKLGFHPLSVRKGYYDGQVDAQLMRWECHSGS
jgi:ribosomal-protein-alanine N-acetyltransferase